MVHVQVAKRVVGVILSASPVVLLADLWLHASPLDVEPTLRTLDREHLEEIRETFDSARGAARVFVFLSSGCASCDAGAAAFQAMLEEHDRSVTVFAIWAPIAPTDPPPPPHFVDHLRDRRVVQLWDPEHLLSDAIHESELAHPGSIPQHLQSGILHDTLVVFGPGVRWGATLPEPDFVDGGVEAVLDAFHLQLHSYPP